MFKSKEQRTLVYYCSDCYVVSLTVWFVLCISITTCGCVRVRFQGNFTLFCKMRNEGSLCVFSFVC